MTCDDVVVPANCIVHVKSNFKTYAGELTKTIEIHNLKCVHLFARLGFDKRIFLHL